MKTYNELNNKDLNNVSAGGNKLIQYLKTLIGKDKNKIIVDSGDGKQLDLNPSIKVDDNNEVYVIKREKCDAELK